MGIVMLEVCESNPAASFDLEQLETTYPGLSVIRNECLSHCQLCAQSPYVLINGDIVAAASLEELMVAIHSRIQTALEQWD